jgi:hypothetical protein
MQLYDASVGDVITLPAHYPATVTVTGWRGAFGTQSWTWGRTDGDLAQFSWTADGGWSGVTSMSEAAQVVMVAKAGPDNPIRKQYENDLEAELAKLAATIGED